MKVIGITGTNGSGKGTVAQLIVDNFHCKYQGTRDLIMAKAKEVGVEISGRTDMHHFANSYSQSGRGFISDFVAENMNTTDELYVLESIRRPIEMDRLKAMLGDKVLLIAVDADPEVRYHRVFEGRQGQFDHVTFEKFIEEEKMEMDNPEPHKQNIGKCVSLADVVIVNDGDISDLERQVLELPKKFPDFFLL